MFIVSGEVAAEPLVEAVLNARGETDDRSIAVLDSVARELFRAYPGGLHGYRPV
jgi:hypothetical protein